MPQGVTKNLILFISACFVLSLVKTNLQFELALYGAAVDRGQYYRQIGRAHV